MDHDLARVRAIFDELIEAPPEGRSALLAERCGDDAVLQRRVEALIATAESNDPFLSQATRDRPAASTLALPPLAERSGTCIGPYKLLQEIGEGGFGVVFMAEQEQPVRRRVALKVIKLGMDTRQVVARFEQERQALALMDHPNIAKVLDAGATESGRPYFVMEYVKGDPLTAFADAHKLSVPDRLELFAQVCAAVQHAHTKGVVHRDLKPRNVLVNMTDGRPFAKVIDFGIAKATGARLTEKTLFTEHRQLIGTPEYMSPEQAEGSPDIDTRTDVYSLGVLLYELLTGTTPFDAARLRSAAFAEMQRIIKEEDPPMPSVRLSRGLETLAATASARQTEPAKLGAIVKGELDWIVMKALEKDRARRYESPNQLATDVRRHLVGATVEAAPQSNTYRLMKFVRRNKRALIAGSIVSAAVLVGTVSATIGITQAIGERTEKERVAARLDRFAEAARLGFERISDEFAGEHLGGMMWRTGPRSEESEQQVLTVIVDMGVAGIRENKKRAASLEAANGSLARQRDIASEAMNKLVAALVEVPPADADCTDSYMAGASLGALASWLEDHPEYADAPEGEQRLRWLGDYALRQAAELREQTKTARLARANLVLAAWEDEDESVNVFLMPPVTTVEALQEAVAARSEYLGPNNTETIRAAMGLAGRQENMSDEALREWIARRSASGEPREALDVTLHSKLAIQYFDKGDMERCLTEIQCVAEMDHAAIQRNVHKLDETVWASRPGMLASLEPGMRGERQVTALKKVTIASLYRTVASDSNDLAERAAALEKAETLDAEAGHAVHPGNLTVRALLLVETKDTEESRAHASQLLDEAAALMKDPAWADNEECRYLITVAERQIRPQGRPDDETKHHDAP